ncbi:5-oxoprolinase subunit C family protein [Mangrovibacterium diazotrophicum]|uniref:Biotin-dependent carboxylase-like uncharacterized protein n=1 Tax=Mangrovibacterium diazotrophicum TaxID=1261403 RepID=A0A419W4Q9_9BACT|nr:biotin-dependent carboxyltransferase family protein [Mangrovibacterium diazotrophicum]RKD90451.1 biotin-dependent carboxylase-like uncharacterized protein [Mangrovibacterium diazotrophicum]
MRKIRIIQKGLLTTIQDAGRLGYQQYGMPVSGAMDLVSLRLANLLVGNSPDEACLETTFLGPEIEFLADAEIAVCGAETDLRLNGSPIALNCNHRICRGDMLKLGTCKRGLRNYIAFAGGLDVPVVMGSKSTYLRGKLGGWQGRALENGDVLPLGEARPFQQRSLTDNPTCLPQPTNEIRIIAGSEVTAFTREGLQIFLNCTYTVSPQSDRMGYRLSGPPVAHKTGADILSSGIANGTIQVPSHGEPIIMLADRQTVGGYTKIANAISADLPLLGQMRPGDCMRFIEVKTEEAQRLLQDQIDRVKAAVKQG